MDRTGDLALAMPSFAPQRAAWYLALFIAFWATNIAAVATRSNQLSCGPDGCQTPTYPVIFAAVGVLAVGIAVMAFRLVRENDELWQPYEPWLSSPLQHPMFRFTFWWWMTSCILLLGLAIPAAIKALRHH
jgi:hypothetical protein